MGNRAGCPDSVEEGGRCAFEEWFEKSTARAQEIAILSASYRRLIEKDNLWRRPAERHAALSCNLNVHMTTYTLECSIK